jgi:hypothetical protein
MRKRTLAIISSLLLSATLLFLVSCQQLNTETPIEENSEVQDYASVEENAEAQDYASISGRIYYANNGEPIAGARVFVYQRNVMPGSRHATTDAKGHYTVTNLNTNEATVGVKAEGYVDRYYNGGEGVYSPYEAVKVKTVYGKDTPEIDIAMEWGGSVTGRLYMPDGVTPVKRANVLYLQTSGDRTPFLATGDEPTPPYQYVRSKPDGSYNIGGLLMGDYDLLIRSVGLDEGFYAHTTVSVVKGQEANGVDFVLEPGGSISGHVYLSDGVTPAGKVNVNAHNLSGFGGDYGNEAAFDGSYSIEQLPPGDYKIRGEVITVSSGENTAHDIILPD